MKGKIKVFIEKIKGNQSFFIFCFLYTIGLLLLQSGIEWLLIIFLFILCFLAAKLFEKKGGGV